MLETHGPVPAFTDAVQARDLNRAAALLAGDVRLSVPPMHYTRRGPHEVVDALISLLHAFEGLRYDVRSRYVTPGSVTDEAVLTGRQVAPFLGGAPSGQWSAVAVRVIVTHDAATVTGIALWPDLAALRAAVGGTSRLIDLTKVGDAGAMVARLRATIPPPPQARLIIGSAREEPPPSALLLPDVTAVPAPDGGPLAGRVVPKPPVPRTVRRRRAFLAGSAMAVLSGALTLWVALGALSQPGTGSPVLVVPSASRPVGAAAASGTTPATGASGGTASGGTASGGAAGADGGAAGTTGPGAGPDDADTTSALADATPSRLTINRTEVVLRSDVLFDTDSARLKPEARALLDLLVADARAQRRQGVVVVSGFTDDVGPKAYNLRLSRKRAATVAAFLTEGLAGAGMTFTAKGYGTARPIAPNDSDAHRALNRRVTIKFPRVSTPAPASTPGRPPAPVTPRPVAAVS